MRESWKNVFGALEGPGKSWNFLLAYDTGGRQNGVGVGADAEICACAHLYRVTELLSVLSYSLTHRTSLLHSTSGYSAFVYMRLVTSVCLYIYMLLVYERVLEKCFWGTGKSWKSPGNFSEQKSGNHDIHN